MPARNFILSRVLCVAALCALAVPAMADWDLGDGHKMHYPQLPDPEGWDIDMTNYTLADDWLCTGSGPVDDIHFWYSVKMGDHLDPPHFGQVKVSIHDDVPADDPLNPYGYSMPGTQLWERTFEYTEDLLNGPENGPQGFDDPQPYDTDPQRCAPGDHSLFWQVNITDIVEPFVQQEGEIYWLDLQILDVAEPDPVYGHPVGWKTTVEIFNDMAVYRNPAGGGAPWIPIAVCNLDAPTDLAFVITPEPSTMGLLALGGLALIRRRRTA